MNLFIFSNFFPFKRSEPFLINEFNYTQKSTSTVSIISLYGKSNDSSLNTLHSSTFAESVFESPDSKKKIVLKGIFNLAPFNFHLADLFASVGSLKQAYWFFISLLITRSALSSKAYKHLNAVIQKSEDPVLYFYWGDNLCWTLPYLIKKNRNKNLKVVVRLHGSDLYEWVKGDYAPLRKIIFSQADLIVTVSENGKMYLIKKYPEIAAKIVVSRLGVFDHGLNPYIKGNSSVVVSVSNLVALKRIPLIFEALQQTKGTIIWYHFGDGVLAQELKELVKSARAGLTVHFKGHVKNEQLIDFYKTQSVDLFINASSSEGLPVSIMEALSFGIPVIAPDIGGISELISDETGVLLAPYLTALDLSSSIEKVLTSENADKLRINARKMFEGKVSAEKNYTEFYEKLSKL